MINDPLEAPFKIEVRLTMTDEDDALRAIHESTSVFSRGSLRCVMVPSDQSFSKA